MFHELLMALWGREGDVFKLCANGLEVNPSLSFLHPSEIAQLNRTCQV